MIKDLKLPLYESICILSIISMTIINNLQKPMLSIAFMVMTLTLIKKPLYLLPPLLVSSLNETYFVLFEGVSISRFLAVLFILSSLFSTSINNKRIKSSHYLLLFIMITYTIVSALTSLTGDIAMGIGMVLNFLLTFFIINLNSLQPQKLFKLFSIALSIYVTSIALLTVTGGAVYMNNRLVIDEAVNANRLGTALSLIGTFFIALILVQNKFFNKFISSFYGFLTIILLFLTGSRSAFIGMLIGVLFLYLMKLIHKEKLSKKVAVSLSLVFISILFIYLIRNNNNDALQRFTLDSILESGGTNRTDIWRVLINYVIPENFIFGVGFGGENVAISLMPYFKFEVSGTHNIFLAILTQLGLTGLLVYMFIFIRTLVISIKKNTAESLIGIPLALLVTAFGNGIGEDIFTERFLWILIGLVYWLVKREDIELYSTMYERKTKQLV